MSSGAHAGGPLDLDAIEALIGDLRGHLPTDPDAPDVEPEDAAVALEACVQEIEALRTALRPFAVAADGYLAGTRDGMLAMPNLTVGDLRRAAEVLGAAPGAPE